MKASASLFCFVFRVTAATHASCSCRRNRALAKLTNPQGGPLSRMRSVSSRGQLAGKYGVVWWTWWRVDPLLFVRATETKTLAHLMGEGLCRVLVFVFYAYDRFDVRDTT